MNRVVALAALVALLTASSSSARAEQPLKYDLRIDLPVTITGSLFLVLSEGPLKPSLAPRACHWCDPGGLDWGVRNAVVWTHKGAAATASDAIGLGLVPISALALTGLASLGDRQSDHFPLDAMIVLESGVIALSVNQITKVSVGRQRPYAHADALDGKTDDGTDDNLSFFSGHTSLAFALATSSGTVASMRGYRYAPLVWATGMTLAVGTGYLRMAADKHYLTDVLVGAVAGASIGFVVPYVFHGPRAANEAAAPAALQVAPLRGGSLITIGGVW